ncbi:MAG: type I-E CRISPR-associated protein Cas5/CasD, partial [Acidobacteriota bacterium]
MNRYLILHLQGPMQSWGGHTFETYRNTMPFPTRSGLVGLLGACLGIERRDHPGLQALNDSFRFAARLDGRGTDAGARTVKIEDFHTILEARDEKDRPRPHAILSRREYLCDASFTVSLQAAAQAAFSLEQLAGAVQRPRYTPFLGRRCCPLGRPLLGGTVQAASLLDSLSSVPPGSGTIYSEEERGRAPRMQVRDVPLFGGNRQFANRIL